MTQTSDSPGQGRTPRRHTKAGAVTSQAWLHVTRHTSHVTRQTTTMMTCTSTAKTIPLTWSRSGSWSLKTRQPDAAAVKTKQNDGDDNGNDNVGGCTHAHTAVHLKLAEKVCICHQPLERCLRAV